MTDDDDDLALVVRLELRLLEPSVRNDPSVVRSLLHPDFREHGASGRVWDRASVTDATAGSRTPVRAQDVAVRRLGPDAALVTYVSHAAGRRALRSSVWVREAGRWLALFHQGTLLPPA